MITTAFLTIAIAAATLLTLGALYDDRKARRRHHLAVVAPRIEVPLVHSINDDRCIGCEACGAAWKQEKTMIVPDVAAFPGHIACSALTRSEIVIPIRDSDGRVAAVLDVDSTEPADFSILDGHALEQLCELLQPLF